MTDSYCCKSWHLDLVKRMGPRFRSSDLGISWTFRSVLLIVCWFVVAVCGQQQSFREQPTDTDVVRGQVAVLKCSVSNRAGEVQWTKDGFALGFVRDIPGYPRYSMVGDINSGEYNLRIENVDIEDDAAFQCQVMPTSDNRAIRANAHLNVLLPPITVEIVDRPSGGTLEIRPHETLELTCMVKDGKPAATIKWYRRNVEIRVENEEYTTVAGSGSRQNAKSKIRLHPTPDDNGATYACEGNHPALPEPIRAQISLSVLYPPGPPEIEGYQEGEVIRMGDAVTLTCVSRGGNPLATLIWSKNGREIDRSYNTGGRESVNSLTFTVDSTDNGATYSCAASNSVSQGSKTASVKMMVQFAPSHVNISGPKEAKVNSTVNLKCVTDRSNPAANVTWVIDGRPVPSRSSIAPATGGGWKTTSEVRVEIQGRERSLMFQCYAVHQALSQTIVETYMLTVLAPPNQPTIVGYQHGATIRAGTLQKLTCVALGGNPPANLTWWKGTQKLKTDTNIVGSVASSELAIIVEASDNNAEYRCEATNSATRTPLATNVSLNVLFPPSGVVIRATPKKPKAGKKVQLQCDSASSNPESVITWWKDGYIIESKPNRTENGPHGGKSTISIIRLEVTSAEDGATYTCQATNEVLGQSVHDAVQLSVLYKPEFQTLPSNPVSVAEGEVITINVTAKGNPSEITYIWMKDEEPVPTKLTSNRPVYASGAILYVTNASRTDSGNYSVQAKSAEGHTITTIQLDVRYPPKITEITNSLMIDEGGDAYLECIAEGNPSPASFVSWKRSGGSELLTGEKQTYRAGKSLLTITSVTKQNAGTFVCTAENTVGSDAKETQVIVKYKPVIDSSPQYAKAAAERGQTARITCRAEGAPDISFTWLREGETLTTAETKQLGPVRWESVLSVSNVKPEHYGPYECIARNELGVATTKIPLELTGRPDTPVSLQILNISHNSVLLGWIPGFDGGLSQSFRIRYRSSKGPPSLYSDVDPTNTTQYVINNLDVATEYAFSIMAWNDLGASEFSTDIVKVTTLSEVPTADRDRIITQVLRGRGEIPRIVIISVSVVGMFLLVLNVALVMCFIRRRRKKRLDDESSEQSSSKTATIEMYAPSSYNGTVTGETLSSISEEKSEAYSEGGHSNEDYGVRKDELHPKQSMTTYLTDHVPPDCYTIDTDYRPDLTAGIHQNTLPRLRNNVPNSVNIYESEDGGYADALRKNAYNQQLGDKLIQPKTPIPPPLPAEARYVAYPPSILQSVNPQLSTFSSMHSIPPPIPPLPMQDMNQLPPEMQGHLV